VTVTGNSPGISTGCPAIKTFVGLNLFTLNMLKVLDPAFTTKTSYKAGVSLRLHWRYYKRTHIIDGKDGALGWKSIRASRHMRHLIDTITA
jgi:hypothetical protein